MVVDQVEDGRVRAKTRKKLGSPPPIWLSKVGERSGGPSLLW